MFDGSVSPGCTSGAEPHTHTPCVVACSARNRALGPSNGSATRSVSIENPVENISVSTTSRASSPAASAMHPARWAKLASRSSHTMSCWTAATFTA